MLQAWATVRSSIKREWKENANDAGRSQCHTWSNTSAVLACMTPGGLSVVRLLVSVAVFVGVGASLLALPSVLCFRVLLTCLYTTWLAVASSSFTISVAKTVSLSGETCRSENIDLQQSLVWYLGVPSSAMPELWELSVKMDFLAQQEEIL